MAKHKYGAIPKEVDNIKFPSTAEANRYEDLKLLVSGGVIKNLELQPRYPLVVNDLKVGEYRADFSYFDNEIGKWVVEDVKGVKTPVYKLKKKLVSALYGIEIKEVS